MLQHQWCIYIYTLMTWRPCFDQYSICKYSICKCSIESGWQVSSFPSRFAVRGSGSFLLFEPDPDSDCTLICWSNNCTFVYFCSLLLKQVQESRQTSHHARYKYNSPMSLGKSFVIIGTACNRKGVLNSLSIPVYSYSYFGASPRSPSLKLWVFLLRFAT